MSYQNCTHGSTSKDIEAIQPLPHCGLPGGRLDVSTN